MIYRSSRLISKLETPALANVNTTYNNTTTSANSEDVEVTAFRRFTVLYTLDSGGSGAHVIQFIIQKKDIAGNYFDMLDDAWGLYKMEDTNYATALNESYGGQLKGASIIRIRVVASGTTAGLTFVITNMKFILES